MMGELERVLAEAARGVAEQLGVLGGLPASEILEAAGVGPAAPEHLPYVVKVAVSGDEAEAGDLRAALVAAQELVADALPAVGYDLRRARLSVTIARDGQYDGVATRLAYLGKREQPVVLLRPRARR